MLLQDLIHIISNTSAEAVQEEFLDLDGTYDIAYLKYLLEDKRLKIAKVNQELTAAGLPFRPLVKEVTNEVSEAEFNKEYEFGKFGNVREWIQHFSWKHKKVLTRKALFSYILPEHHRKQAYRAERFNAQKKVS